MTKATQGALLMQFPGDHAKFANKEYDLTIVTSDPPGLLRPGREKTRPSNRGTSFRLAPHNPREWFRTPSERLGGESPSGYDGRSVRHPWIGRDCFLNEELRPAPHIAAYYQTWSAEAGPLLDETFGQSSHRSDEILLAFVRPDLAYAGDLDLSNTGLEVPYSGSVLKASLAALKMRNPGVKILISVGGETYTNWTSSIGRRLKRFVRDLNLMVSIWISSRLLQTARIGGTRVMWSNSTLFEIVTSARSALPRPYVLWLTATNTGAYGEGAWRAQPQPDLQAMAHLCRSFVTVATQRCSM